MRCGCRFQPLLRKLRASGSDNAMTDAYVTIGCEAYISGRPLVNMGNRVAAFTGLPAPSVLGVVDITVTSKGAGRRGPVCRPHP